MFALLAQSAAVETPTDAVGAIIFFALAALTVLSAWAIVLSQNIVRMSVYLMFTLGGAAGMYLALAAEFLAVLQLIVYAGGTLILIIFGIMLTSKSPFVSYAPRMWERFAGVGLGVALAGLLLLAAVTSRAPAPPTGEAAASTSIRRIGEALLTDYLLPFELAAVLLLVVMIGAAYMARRRVTD